MTVCPADTILKGFSLIGAVGVGFAIGYFSIIAYHIIKSLTQ